MKWRNISILGIAIGLGFTLAVPSHPTVLAQPGIGERIGAEIDEGLSQLGSEVREGWQSLRQGVNNMGIQARVYSRLRWDKNLAGAELDVDVPEDGVIALRGRVKDAAAKEKAIQLAQDTVGVDRVLEGIEVVASVQPADR